MGKLYNSGTNGTMKDVESGLQTASYYAMHGIRGVKVHPESKDSIQRLPTPCPVSWVSSVDELHREKSPFKPIEYGAKKNKINKKTMGQG